MSTYGARHAPSAFSTPASIALFRRLTWEGTVPLEVRVDPKELPANSNRGLECYFLQAPRVSYLPLLIPEIRSYLLDVVFDEAGGRVVKEEEWWFEREDGGLVKWHWPIGLIYDTHAVSLSASASAPSSSSSAPVPLKLTLHLASPPTDKLLLQPSAEACKQAFMGQLKEADFIRWGNTKRMTGLRKQDQDGLWDGIKEHDFDAYWRIASKITPTPAPLSGGRSPSPSPVPPSSASMVHTRPPDRDAASAVRSVPARIYLPDGPVLQDLVPPGAVRTLGDFLRAHLPLLFPLDRPDRKPLAYALVQGVRCPGDAEMAWLGACMAGADGWVNVCVGVEGA
ncbi:APG5-domain-containing protein [Gloeophyllum trabeum ATCC 11539]|uniref:Autophagy protein 5 n=1 Tax=Gloeophyllum trabeum (strain ATCC 11539 / FP-39264 / Madison 617) TaxID=670483 RepID=S7QE15_GLOTA|nr:APG5-domain-containing protein [Gloeophyllum trabeum ATCC 11539]EPQ57662.1 APG5-domain-containing protein [Gloeophyllum trabeum ATCC 11539]